VLKATEHKFAKMIKFERVIICIAPVIYLALMLPMTHFWTMFNSRDSIESTFTTSIQKTIALFDSYETYANKRVADLETTLAAVPVKKMSAISKANKVEALRIQLLGDNYTNLAENAKTWIGAASGTTVWNVFMIGNIKTIEDAIDSWVAVLENLSSKVVTEEAEDIKPYGASTSIVKDVEDGFNHIRTIYTTFAIPALPALLCALGLYFMLLFPYLIQARNTKSTYTLWGRSTLIRKRVEGAANEFVAESFQQNEKKQSKVTGTSRSSFTL
jgi:hypothetical protein